VLVAAWYASCIINDWTHKTANACVLADLTL
jgi:hypothetical protein